MEDAAREEQLIVSGIVLQLFPYVEQEEDRILDLLDLERIGELEAILLEREDLEAVLVEMTVKAAVVTREAVLVTTLPDGSHRHFEDYLLEMIGYHHAQVLVDRRDGYGMQVRELLGEHLLGSPVGERMGEESLRLLLFEQAGGNQKNIGIDPNQGLTGGIVEDIAGFESLTQVGCHRDTAIDDVRFYRLNPAVVCSDKSEGVLTYMNGEARILFFTIQAVCVLHSNSFFYLCACKVSLFLVEYKI